MPGFLALALFMFRVDADHPHHTLAVNDLALVTDLFYRCSYFHNSSQLPGSQFSVERSNSASFIAINNSAAVQIVGGKLHRNFVTRQDANEILSHLARHMRQHLVLVLQFHLEHGVGQRLQDHGHHFNRVFFTHSLLAFSPWLLANPLAWREAFYLVKIIGPSFVTATQCSKCALQLPSAVTAVHLSPSTRVSGFPKFTMGSMAITIPSRSFAP